jgi:hypothetical protein
MAQETEGLDEAYEKEIMSNWVEIVCLWPQANSTPDAQGITVLLREASDLATRLRASMRV